MFELFSLLEHAEVSYVALFQGELCQRGTGERQVGEVLLFLN